MINRVSVYDDVQGAVGQWKRAGVRHLGPSTGLDAAVDTALSVVADPTWAHGGTTARFCIVTKGPHLRQPLSLACVAARLTAFGVTVHALHRLDGAAHRVVQALYPRATRFFAHGPTTRSHWDGLARRFDTAEFERIFGCRYERSLVRAAADVIRDNGLSPAEFSRIWEGGRPPVTRDALISRYGTDAATFVLGGAETYEWFRGVLPVGISRVASSLTAFAMRDERIDGGAPVIVVNGHVPGLAELFGPATWVFELGLGATGVQIGDVRRVLAGDDGRPVRCPPGSLRRDAADGLLPHAGSAPITSRLNVVHCSDGLVAGLTELHALVPGCAAAQDLLRRDLAGAGLTGPEISDIVLQDPCVLPGTPNGHLTDVTRGLDLRSCVAETIRVVPAVFGPVNGHADGIEFTALRSALQDALRPATAVPRETGATAAYASTRWARPGDRAEAAGRAAIRAGVVGMLVPAGGTGGRFGGYDVSEGDPSRQKALARVFTVAGRCVSSLDIRLANVRYWDDGMGDRVPVAVMGSPTGEVGLRAWRETLPGPQRKTLRIIVQHGVYRVGVPSDDDVTGRWIDAILRDGSGRPSLKPSGSLSLLSCFILSRLFDSWESRGVEYLAVANADDVGYRLDPRAIGHLAADPGVDGIVVAVPWGYAATVRNGDTTVAARGDESGWSTDENGVPLAEPVPVTDRVYDRGGAVSVVPNGSGSLLLVTEGRSPAAELFNTNQFYLRVSALRRALDRGGPVDPLQAVRRLVARQPVSFEDKSVLLDRVQVRARQISQPLHGVLRWLDRCDVMTATRHVVPGVRGSYATLKHPADVRFAQLILDRLQSAGGELVTRTYWSS